MELYGIDIDDYNNQEKREPTLLKSNLNEETEDIDDLESMLKQNNSIQDNQDQEEMQGFEEYLKMLEGMEHAQSEDRDIPSLKANRGEDLSSDDDMNHREYAEFMKRIYDIDIDEMADNSSKRLQSKP